MTPAARRQVCRVLRAVVFACVVLRDLTGVADPVWLWLAVWALIPAAVDAAADAREPDLSEPYTRAMRRLGQMRNTSDTKETP